MNIYVLSPITTDKFKEGLAEAIKSISSGSRVEYLTTPTKLANVKELQSEDEKIVVIDPDFVEWEVTAEDLASVKNLRAILVSSTSFGWVDKDYLNEHNIPLVNIKDWCTQAVAEWAIMMALNLARKVPLLIKEDFPLNYEHYCGVQLRDRTVGIVGMGNIGKALAERAKGLGMSVVYWSKNSQTDLAEYVPLGELFKSADFIFPTMADNSETQKVITDDLLKSLKKTSYFISVVHRYYNHDLLLEMVKHGNLAGYGFEDEATGIKDYVGNVWVTPAYAWCTLESFETNDRKLLENIKAVLVGDFSGKVN